MGTRCPLRLLLPPMLGGLSPPGALTTLQHQLPVSGYSTPSPATIETQSSSSEEIVPSPPRHLPSPHLQALLCLSRQILRLPLWGQRL